MKKTSSIFIRQLLVVLAASLAASLSASECDSIPGSERLFAPGNVVLLGVIHGTKECPQSVADLVCEALKRGLAVTVGLEIPVAEQEKLDSFMISDGDDALNRTPLRFF